MLVELFMTSGHSVWINPAHVEVVAQSEADPSRSLLRCSWHHEGRHIELPNTAAEIAAKLNAAEASNA